MRNKEIDEQRLDPDLLALVQTLQQTPLEAAVPDRDRLMYRCGQVSAAKPARRSVPSRFPATPWVAAALVILAFGLGGLTGRWTHIPTGTDDPIARERAEPDTTPTPLSPAVAAVQPAGFDPETMSVILSGQHLFAAMDPALVSSLPAGAWPDATLPAAQSGALRAGMTDQWDTYLTN